MDLFYYYFSDIEGQTHREKEHNAGRFILEQAGKNFYNIKNTEVEVINGKPKYKYSNIEFSISHKGYIVIVLFDKNPVGVDIEILQNRDFEMIAKRMNFKLKNHTPEEFYTCWTLYEAEYKLQKSAKSRYTFNFNKEYIISAVTSEQAEIEKNLKIYEITKNGTISLK